MNKKQFLIRLAATFCALLLVAVIGCAKTSRPEKGSSPSTTRIGVYDSRAIAVAFVGSEVYKATVGKKMADMMTEYKKAESEGDKKRVKELKELGESQQTLLHKQGFSTAPVDDILEFITNKLPGIKKQANVEMLVSKWDTQTLAQQTSAEQVDVTMLLVEAFRPNEKQKKFAIDIQKHDPMSLKEMEDHKH